MSRLLSEVRYRMRALLRREEMEAELDDELRYHIDRHTEKLVGEGMSRAEASRQARLEFGGVERIRDEARDARGVVLLETVLQDIRYALRGLRTRKAFTIGVVLTLGLGIGANATMFGIVDRLLFRAPPALIDQGSVHRVYLHGIDRGEEDVNRNFQVRRYLDVLEQTTSFSDIAAFQTRRHGVGSGEGLREVPVTMATASFFDFFAARPVLGRFFSAAEDSVPVGSPVVVLGYDYWQTQFGGSPDVIGRSLQVDRLLGTIIGVAPEGFVGMSDQGVPAAWVPLTAHAHAFRGTTYHTNYNWSWLEMIVRRRPGISVEEAEADLTQAFRHSWRQAFAASPGWGAVEDVRPRGTLGPVQLERGPQAGRDSRVAAWISGVALIVLLVACANVANLLLSRAVSRRREIAMRLALGVSRGRLLRQLFSESLVLAVLGGAAGLLIAHWGGAGLRALFLPPDFPAGAITDGRTLLYLGAVTLLVAILTGLVPALHAGRTDLAGTLKTGGREDGFQRSRTGAALLVVQAALSVVLLVGAGLFVRSLHNVQQFRLGYDVDPILFASANSRGTSMDDAARRALNLRMLEAAETMPGVSSAALAASVPFWSNEGRGLWVAGIDTVRNLGNFILQAGTPDYFRTLGTRVFRGRAFDERDRENTQRVVVVGEGMARALWPGQDAIGQCLRIAAADAPCTRVIGVAEDMRVRTLTDEREYTYYIPASQYGEEMYPQLFVRVDVEGVSHAEALRRRLQAEMPGAAYVTVQPLRELVDPSLRAWSFGATMFVAFGVLALVLAAIGLYSMIAYGVAQRTRELGVRLALGASAGHVVRMIVATALRLVVIGVAIGGAIAIWAAPRLEPLMFDASTRDPAVYGAVAATLVGVALVASVVPAMRALRVDPNTVLRAD
ncbi:MAG TPA: ABC transporter permease [Longimicrobiales bacterium]|nr:ABC transporter permease [Longimicrobiales bacterium]